MKRNRIFLAGLLAMLSLAIMAYGVPSFTPVIDGVKDPGWGSTPDHETNTDKEPLNFGVDSCYVTDDSANVYIGMATDLDPWGGEGAALVHFLIDIRNTTAGGDNDPYWTDTVFYDMTYLPEYEIISEWDEVDSIITGGSTDNWSQKCTWNGSSWNIERYNTVAGKIEGGGNQFTEILLKRTEFDALGQGDTINISVWCKPASWFEGGKPNANSCLPADEDFPTDWGDASSAHTFSSQFFYVIQTVLVDTTKPQVVSATQAGADKVIVDFDEPMNQATLVFGNFTIDGGLTFTASQVLSQTSVLLTANTSFTGSTLYTVTASSSVTDVVGNQIDPANNTASFTAVAYALMTFVYVDQNADLTNLYCKGSFDDYGNYNSGWTVTPFQMYDDGTNGSDTTASDGRWTAQFYLKPSLNDTFHWGSTEGQYGDWAMDCEAPEFQVLDATPGQVQIYTVPLYALVTFRVDDSQAPSLTQCWVKGTFNSIGRYEGGWGDYHQAFDDGFHNDLGANDNIWGVEINLVPDAYCHDSTWEWGAADAYNGTWIIDGPNRQFAVPTSAPRIETYTVIPKTSQAVTVTFEVDMQFLLLNTPLTIDSMAVAGDFNGWDNTANIMSDLDNDSVYAVDVLFDSGSVRYQEFKFVRWDAGVPDWEFDPNWVFLIDDATPTDTVYRIWNDWIPEIGDLTVQRDDNLDHIKLDWSPYNRIDGYYIWRGAVPDLFGLIDSTATSAYVDSNAVSGSAKYFYQVKAYKHY